MKRDQLTKKEKRNSQKNLLQFLGIVVFGVILISGMILGFWIPLRPETSEVEKRTLTKFPEYRFGEFLDGTYTNAISIWYADTFPYRDSLLEAQQNLKKIYGIRTDEITAVGQGDDIPDFPDWPEDPTEPTEPTDPTDPTEPTDPTDPTEPSKAYSVDDPEIRNPQTAGQANVKDLVGYSIAGFNKKCADTYAEAVANAAKELQGITQVYEMIVPDNSAIMLDEETKKAWGIIDEKKVTEYYRAKTNSLQTGIRYVMLYEALSAKKNEYIYFKTDHHWTHLGAYYAYVTFCRAKGITPHSLSEYDTNYIPKFTGSYVTASGFSQLDANPDTVTSYVPITYNQFSFSLRESPSTWWENKLIVRDLSGAGVHSAYQAYIFGDNPISIITNPTIHNGESCIIVKDSFGNAFSTFLTDHYEKVYILDYRYYDGNIVDLAKENHITDLIFELNVDTASYLPHMEFIKQRCYGTK